MEPVKLDHQMLQTGFSPSHFHQFQEVQVEQIDGEMGVEGVMNG